MKTQAKAQQKRLISEKIIREGLKHRATPYRFGAKPFQIKEFDCSSFVQFLYSNFRILLPRTSREQCLLGNKVKKERLKRGDLLFFTNGIRFKKKGIEKVAHIAIFLGDDKILHSCRTRGVTVSRLTDIINKSKQKSWNDYYLFAKRLTEYDDLKME